MNLSRLGLLLLTLSSLLTAFENGWAQENKLSDKPLPIHWQIKPLALDANEGCAVGDINGDGKLDVVAGRSWFPGPDLTPQPLRNIEDWNGYVQSNGDFLFDMNSDGRLDVIAGSFLPSEVHWYENPSKEDLRLGHSWPKHLLVDTKASENEAQLMQDIDGDGVPEWIVNSWIKTNPMIVWRLVKGTDSNDKLFHLEKALIGTQGNQHGMGVGDLNGDGRVDLLIGSGWYEQPANAWSGPWPFHADWDIQASIPMIVTDLDRDGRQDVIVGAGHDYGLYWWKQLPSKPDGALVFDRILIDKSFSQPHAIAMADLDGDGSAEIITGKRYYAHNGGDPGGQDMPEIHAYSFQKGVFTRSVIERGHVGIGLQIATGDLNGDGRIDIAVAGKSGTFALLNLPITTEAKK